MKILHNEKLFEDRSNENLKKTNRRNIDWQNTNNIMRGTTEID